MCRLIVSGLALVLAAAVSSCSSSSGGQSCAGGSSDCSGTCTNLSSDALNCGACGHACNAGEACDSGSCVVSCQAGRLDCSGSCIDPMADRDHCGASGTCSGSTAGQACAAGEVCSAGTCATSCQPGLVNCSGTCVNPRIDPSHCGVDAACAGGATCAPGYVCDERVCRLSCQTGLVNCNGRCVDPATDRSFCGSDAQCNGGSVCGPGTICTAGVCALSCPSGEYACGGKCIDPLSDPSWCGAHADCSGATPCGIGAFCSNGACWSPCPAGQVLCGGHCIDPSTNASYCGASGLCTGATAGAVCAADHECRGGACLCPTGRVECGGTCIDPLIDEAHCGAGPTCSGAQAGTACTASQRCVQGTCQLFLDFDWRPGDTSAPGRFEQGPTTLAHIVFDGSNMVDLTGHTSWTKVGSPGVSAPDGMWSPPQSYSGPFSSTAYWVGDALTKTYLDTNTAGDFTVCARYKPGVHPLTGPNKIVIANGTPEAPGTGGWSLMQMHQAYCFHYHDTVTGEMMQDSTWSIDGPTLATAEWTWQCGGRSSDTRGGYLHVLRESYAQSMLGPIGSFSPSPSTDLPSIGAYSDGSAPLLDGGVYEILITSDPATAGNMYTTIARASRGVRTGNEAPFSVTGADGALHTAAPSTITVLPPSGPGAHGTLPVNQRVFLGRALDPSHDPRTTGECFGLEASAVDWTAVPAGFAPLAWILYTVDGYSAGSYSEMRWDNPASGHCANARNPSIPGVAVVCGNPAGSGTLGTGKHTLLQCFDPADRQIRIYADGATVPFATSGPIQLDQFPRLDDPNGTLVIDNDTVSAANLQIHRVFACSTPDPSVCR